MGEAISTDEGSVGSVEAKEPIQWQLQDEQQAAEVASPGRSRPPHLDLSQLRYSTHSATSTSASPDSPDPSKEDSSSSPADKKVEHIKPSFKLLFSFTSRTTFFTVVVPATICAVLSGLVPPYMTQVLGDSLQAFTNYANTLTRADLTLEMYEAAKTTLLHSMRDKAIKLALIAAAVFFLTSGYTALWVIYSERVVRDLRLHVYKGLSAKGLDWYDKGMGGVEDDGEGGNDKSDAAGLMGRFTK
jgi:ATP-binding cassette subfamily B (MDR/TAP) protein 1